VYILNFNPEGEVKERGADKNNEYIMIKLQGTNSAAQTLF